MIRLNLICAMFILITSTSLYADTYVVKYHFQILPKNENLNEAIRKSENAVKGDKVTILSNTGYKFESRDYTYIRVKSKSGDDRGIFFVYTSQINSYIKRKILTKASSTLSLKPRRSTKTKDSRPTSSSQLKSSSGSKNICERLSGTFVRFANNTKVHYLKGPKRGGDTQIFTSRKIFSFKVFPKEGQPDKCVLSMKARGKNELRSPRLTFETDSSNFIQPNGKLNLYGYDKLTLDKYDPPTVGSREIKVDTGQPSEPETTSRDSSQESENRTETFCEKLFRYNPRVRFSPTESVVYKPNGVPIVIGRGESTWRFMPEIESSAPKKCTIIRLDSNLSDIPGTQLEVDLSGAVESEFYIKEHPLFEAIKIASRSISDDASEIEPKVSESEKCEVVEDEKTQAVIKYPKCKKTNNYLEKKLKKLVTKEDRTDESDAKICIYSSMMASKYKSGRTLVCNSRNSPTHSSIKPCVSNNYVSYIHSMIKKVSGCFPNISMEKVLPIMNQESHMYHNSTNDKKPGSEAIGLMQLTNPLIKSIDRSVFNDAKVKNTEECKELKSRLLKLKYKKECKTVRGKTKCKNVLVRKIPYFETRNKCKAVSIPSGVEAATFMTLQQINHYSYQKRKVTHSGTTYKNTTYMKFWLERFFGKENFKRGEINGIIYDLSSILHSRGKGDFIRMLVAFAHDLKNEGKRKGRSSKYGNRKIYKLWNSKFKGKITRELFLKYFSSYIYYERQKYHGKRKEKDLEGGSFVLNQACNQMRIEAYAKEKTGKNVTCGESSVPDFRRKIIMKLAKVKYDKELTSTKLGLFCSKRNMKSYVSSPLEKFYR